MRRTSWSLFVTAFCVCLVVEGGGGGGGGNSNWRQCCEYAFNPRCKGGCRKAKSRDDLEHTCLADQDFSVFNCLEKQDVGLKCCSSKKELSSKCLSACRAVFVKDQWPSEWDLSRVGGRCTQDVIACIENYTRSHPARNMADSLPCCDDKAVSDVCRSKCRTALNTLTKEEEAIDEVLRYCGIPDLTSSLWQCFLRRSTGSRRDVINVASIRLGCCRKASSPQCRNLCVKNYHLRHLAFTDEFDQRCLYSPLENDLSVCLEEVENRCEPGCNDLKYCNNFNNRPEISFRSCHLQSDIGAQQIVQLWSLGTIMKSSVFNFDIPIKNIGLCEPNKWKAIACTMFIRPCHPKSLSGSICRSDCMDVLSKCLDTSRLTQPGISAETICDKLSPRNSSSACISLSLYLTTRSVRNSGPGEVTTPCNPNPCNASQVCIASWKKCPAVEIRGEESCQPFHCIPGCSLRDGVRQIIPLHAYIRVPCRSDISCFQGCQCGHGGILRQCRQLGCTREEQCVMPSGMIIDHGTVFSRSCLRCACHSGKVTCTKRFCPAHPQPSPSEKATAQRRAQPCGCSSEYAPVCGFNGQTYPSACLARCAEIKSNEAFKSGSCSSQEPCLGVSCLPNERCFAKRQKCLWFGNSSCKQYDCVALNSHCYHQDSPVCDQNGLEFRNPCHLLQEKRTLAYRGRCLSYCLSVGAVCGVDGDDYTSECAAWASGVVADYSGHCRSVGIYQDVVGGMSFCANVSCSIQRLKHCEPIVPPGACCPICAGEIRLLMSESLLQSSASYLPSGQLTVADVLDALRLHVRILQCEAFGYLNVEGDLTVLIMPIVASPSPLQIEACMTETKRLGYLLGSANPALTAYLVLSVFVSADVRTCRVNSVAARSPLSMTSSNSRYFSTALVVVCLINLTLRSRSL